MLSGDSPELRRSLWALNGVNFFIADVQSGLGPFLGVYLINQHGWNPASIGVILTLGGAIGLFLNAPAGALIDASRHKRALLAIAAALTSFGTLIVTLKPTLAVVTAAQLTTGVGGVVVGPVIAAIALGLVGPRRYAQQTGTMTAFNHAGNVVGSTVAGLAGYLVSLKLGFWIASMFGIFVVVTTLLIKSSLIDNELARGFQEAGDRDDEQPSGLRVLLHNRPLLVLAAVVGLWQLANGAMLPIAGQRLAVGNSHTGALYQAALIIVAQAVMIPMALLTRRSERFGRKPLFLIAFAVLPVRGLLFALFANPGMVIAIQVLDGIGAGLQGPLFAVMVADLTRGSGRYNVAMGATTMVQGIGGALSPTVAGAIYAASGYTNAMLSLTAIAVLALILLTAGVPETLGRTQDPPNHPDDVAPEPTMAT